VESAASGPGDATAVTERVPAREPVVASPKTQLTVVDSTLTQIATSSTTLEGTATDSIPTYKSLSCHPIRHIGCSLVTACFSSR